MREERNVKEYSDYIQAVKSYLRNYTKFKVTVENLQDSIAMWTSEMEHDVNAPISKYGDEPGGGTPELNSVESAAARHEKLTARIEDAKKSIEKICCTLRNVDRALANLSQEDREIIEGHYFQKKSWKFLGTEHYYTDKWACGRARKAVQDMAFMIFGEKALPPGGQGMFVFYE